MNILYNEWVRGMHLVNLSGPLNVSQAEDVIQLFRDLSEQGVERVVINLEDVPFIDSRGLAALIAGYKIFGSDARNFRLAEIQDQHRLLFELTGFDRVFQIFAHPQVSFPRKEPTFAGDLRAGSSVAGVIEARLHNQAQPGCSSPTFASQPTALDLAA